MRAYSNTNSLPDIVEINKQNILEIFQTFEDGGLTYPELVRKVNENTILANEAIDQASDAKTEATAANAKAAQAITEAQAATAVAQAASVSAATALSKANSVEGIAQQANTTANEAKTAAASATAAAAAALAKANSVEGTANDAKTAATAATLAAQAATAAAAQAKATADNAKATADNAKADVEEITETGKIENSGGTRAIIIPEKKGTMALLEDNPLLKDYELIGELHVHHENDLKLDLTKPNDYIGLSNKSDDGKLLAMSFSLIDTEGIYFLHSSGDGSIYYNKDTQSLYTNDGNNPIRVFRRKNV